MPVLYEFLLVVCNNRECNWHRLRLRDITTCSRIESSTQHPITSTVVSSIRIRQLVTTPSCAKQVLFSAVFCPGVAMSVSLCVRLRKRTEKLLIRKWSNLLWWTPKVIRFSSSSSSSSFILTHGNMHVYRDNSIYTRELDYKVTSDSDNNPE